MRRKKAPAHPQNPGVRERGWYVAILVMRFDYYWQKASNPNRRCEVLEKMRLVQAQNRGEAYRKAQRLGRAGDSIECVDQDARRRKGVWRFVGLAELLPVYDKIEDGSDILWTTHYCTAKTAQRMVKHKRELGVFRSKKR